MPFPLGEIGGRMGGAWRISRGRPPHGRSDRDLHRRPTRSGPVS